jgi:D-glycero-alpha-D-manno-heptose-7-phosphate kinase
MSVERKKQIVVSKTPFRVTFLGGGTDFSNYFTQYGGLTIGASINYYGYFVVKRLYKLDPYNYRIIYSKSELCNSIEEIQHPVVKAAIIYTGIKDRLEIHYLSDLPNYSGLGSSSTFTVGLLNALYTLMGYKKSNKQIADAAVEIERIILNEKGGLQDQHTVANSGFSFIKYFKSTNLIYLKPKISKRRIRLLESNLFMYYTGITRNGVKILEAQQDSCDEIRRKILLRNIHDLALNGLNMLKSNFSLDLFGELLNKYWLLKRELGGGVTNDYIDQMYDFGLESGAIGGKLLGAGGGGFLLFYVPSNFHSEFKVKMKKYEQVDFKFSKQGTTIINNLL